MKIQEIQCPFCGGKIEESIIDNKEIICPACGQKIYFDDEVKKSYSETTINKNINQTNTYHKIITDESKIEKEKTERLKIKAIIIGLAALMIIFIITTIVAMIDAARYKVAYYNTASQEVKLDDQQNISVTFTKVIVKEAEKKSLLIVDEQEISIVAILEQKGLFEWGIFNKNQPITYFGTAQFTVDLSKLTENDVEYDKKKNVLTIYVSKPELHDIVFDSQKTTIGDMDRGLLAWGDIKLTPEQQTEMIDEAIARLQARAAEADCMEKANTFAKYVLRDLFETIIAEVDNSVKVDIQFK